jgi:nitrous oxidase accessory protein NosD
MAGEACNYSNRMRYALPALLVVVVAVGSAWVAVERIDVTPRRLAPYIERRAAGHGEAIERAGRHLAGVLLALDRGRNAFHEPMPIPATLAPDSAAGGSATRRIDVDSPEQALRAIAEAMPGDAITFLPGTYRFGGAYIDVRRPGTEDRPIHVRAEVPGTVLLQFDMVEGFLVSSPWWSFENLTIRGVCGDDSRCEHAFHVVSNGRHFVARHNEIVDFNAQFKINGSGGAWPDSGLIEDNVIRNSTVRDTANPVTSIDLVAASHWRIRGNRISDFAKGQSDRISYGAFAKGAGVDNRFERNVVVCEDRLRDAPGQRVGLSLGGGGSSHAACRDRHCITEQERGVVASNLIASCSDDGIYLNRAAQSIVADNTLIDTAGITARFGETGAQVYGNLVDGVVRAFDGAVVHENDNIVTPLPALYVGIHPVRRLFIDAAGLDLRWRGEPPRRHSAEAFPEDLCGAPRPKQPTYGAFEAIARCAVIGAN